MSDEMKKETGERDGELPLVPGEAAVPNEAAVPEEAAAPDGAAVPEAAAVPEGVVAPEGAAASDEPTSRVYIPGGMKRVPSAETSAVTGEEPVEEPTRSITDFERRTLALLGDNAVVRPEKKPGKLQEREKPQGEKRDYRPIRRSREGKSGCLGGIMYVLFVISLSVILAAVAWMAASDVLALNKEPMTAEVTLPTSAFSEAQVDDVDETGKVVGVKTITVADMDVVAGLLKDYGLIDYEWLFKLYSRFSHAERQVDAGTYELSTSYDYRAMVKKMQVGSDSQLQTLVTFPEGFTMQQIFERMEEEGVCSVEDLMTAAANTEYNYSFLEGLPMGDASRLEGFLFPDSYYFYQGMQASSAINKFLSNFRSKLTAEMLQQATDRGLSFREVVTIASMIEKEAASDEDRPLIASVVYNRLSQDMMLQIESTLLYALPGVAPADLTRDMIENTESPYNTYRYTGLPAGPICSPGLASIQAALNPTDTAYVYYALDTESGKHQFFIYYDEFQEFVATQDYG